MIRVLVGRLDGEVEITGDDHHYLFRVRRLAPGAQIVCFDGNGAEADGEVIAVEATRARVRLGPVRREPAAPLAVTALQALIKGDRMDWCIQKLVEVGVARILVFAAERSVVKLDGERAASREARLAAIAREAAKQARRATVPAVEVVDLAAAIAVPADLRVCCHPGGRALRELWGGEAATASVLVGPEGGLAPTEVERALGAGFEPVSLGRTVLRAETAGVVAVSGLLLARNHW